MEDFIILTELQVKSSKPEEKSYMLSDEHGLYLRVDPTGGKLYVNEAVFNSYLCRKYARAPKLQKVHEAIKGKNERIFFLRHVLKNIYFLMFTKMEW